MQKGEEYKIQAAAKALKELDSSDFKFHRMTVDQVLKHFGTNQESGLKKEQIQQKIEEFGENVLEDEESESLWDKIVESFEDPLARILIVAAFISFIIAITGDGEEGIAAYVEPFVIILILVLNAIIAIYQDGDAESALEALKKLQATECQVKRDGKWISMDSKNLVPGDIVKVKMGDNIPADMRIIELNSISLTVEEAPLTGDSYSISKEVEEIVQGGDILQDQKNMLFSSTIVNYGSATGVVVFTGMKTAIGRVQKQVSEAAQQQEDTPLKKKLDDFGEKLTYLIGFVCLLVWLMNYRNFFDEVHGSALKGCIYYFKIAIALAVAAIPEGLPAVITTCLALGTRKMAQNNAIVRRLPSVETLGCTTVICSDKTGTLTKNQMCAVKFAVIDKNSSKFIEYKVQEAKNSYSPVNCKITREDGDFNEDYNKAQNLFKSIAVGCTINNNSRIEIYQNDFKRVGDPTEASLLVLAEKIAGQPKDNQNAFQFKQKLQNEINVIAQLDFTSKRKAMSTIVSGYKNEKDILLKGAPDRVVQKCIKYMSFDGEKQMQKSDQDQILKYIQTISAQGYRCLVLAEIPNAGALKDINQNNRKQLLSDIDKYDSFENDATFVGVICIKDPVRPEVKPAIYACKTAGIKVYMITGDSKETAVSIAKELQIIESSDDQKDCVFTWTEFQALTAKQRKEVLEESSGKVFSRVEPSHKQELVKLLIEQGQIVAMTGDGVNDAPALKQAHIGIAMGLSGTEVAKFASDMVLADDNFATIVKAIEEGRSIYSNMKAFIRYMISSNVGEVLSIFFTALLGIPESFTSVQLLWVNLVTDGPPATALGFNPPDYDIMNKPPRRQDDYLLSTWTLIRFSVIGTYVGFATTGIFIYWYLFAITGDGHTLVTWNQLSNWGECPSWPKDSFKPVNFIEGVDLQSNPCLYFTIGKVKASTLSLSVLVVIEMLNALNAISEDESLLRMSPLVNPYLLLAIAASIGAHFIILYIPIFAKIFGIAPLNLKEWLLVFAFSAPVILIDEILKIFGRQSNAKEFQERISKKQKKNN